MISLLILALTALATSIISGIIGMGGGLLLLATMLSFLPHAETIPAHGAVQLVSNGTRLLVFLRHVDLRTIVRFALGALPGSIVGGLLLVWLRKDHIDSTEPYFKIAIGLYVLITAFRPIGKRQASDGDADWCSGRFELECEDGTQLEGDFVAQCCAGEVRQFEESFGLD